jgi:hypothetical protein
VTLRTKCGTFISPALASQDTEIACGFAPKVVLVWASGSGSGIVSGAVQTFGAAVNGIANEFSVAWTGEDDVNPNNCSRISRKSLVYRPNQDASDAEAATVKSFGATSFVLDWSLVTGAGHPYIFFAIGGDEVVDAHLEELTCSNTVTTVNYTNCGFSPDLLLIFTSSNENASPNTSDDGAFGIGWATATNNQDATCVASLDIVSDSDRRIDTGQVISILRATAHAQRWAANLSAKLVNGYTLNWGTVSSAAAPKFYALTIKGGIYNTQQFTTPGENGTQFYSLGGISEVGGIAANWGRSGFGGNTQCALTIGAWDSINRFPQNQVCCGATALDNSNPSICKSNFSSTNPTMTMAPQDGALTEKAVFVHSPAALRADWNPTLGSAVRWQILGMASASPGTVSKRKLMGIGR